MPEYLKYSDTLLLFNVKEPAGISSFCTKESGTGLGNSIVSVTTYVGIIHISHSFVSSLINTDVSLGVNVYLISNI